jgi:hypothetical protein
MRHCSELEAIPDDELMSWVRGYWTGANLYLGSSDLCVERARVVGIENADIRTLLRVNCSGIQESPIMMSAFNALRGLPTVEGSRASKCAAQE